MAYIHTRHNFSANFAHFLRMRRRMRKKCAKKVFLLFFYLRNFNACVNAYVEFAQILFLRNCAKCANICADLQLCALKKALFCALYKGSPAAGKGNMKILTVSSRFIFSFFHFLTSIKGHEGCSRDQRNHIPLPSPPPICKKYCLDKECCTTVGGKICFFCNFGHIPKKGGGMPL